MINMDDYYVQIARKLDEHAAGAPKDGRAFSPAFMDYLKLLYTPEQAELVRHLNVTSEFYGSGFDVRSCTTAGQLSEQTGKGMKEIKGLLDPLVKQSALMGNTVMGKGVIRSLFVLVNLLKTLKRSMGTKAVIKLIGSNAAIAFHHLWRFGPFQSGSLLFPPMYTLPVYPSLFNVHQFYEYAGPKEIKAGQLYQEFFISHGYYRRYEGSDAGTPTWRTIPVKKTIRTGQRILDTEEAHAIIDASVRASLVPCPCRTRTEKLGIRECQDKNPVATCIMLGLSALHFETAGLGKPVSREKAKQYLDDMLQAGLMPTTENFSDMNHAVICLCCECCCSMVRGKTRWDYPSSVLPSNFIPQPDEKCLFCGICERTCPIGAITVDKKEKRFSLNEGMCIGCGVCTTVCKQEALKLERKERSTPRADAADMYHTIYQENREGK